MKALERILHEPGARLHNCGPRRRGRNSAPRHALLPFARRKGLFALAFKVFSPFLLIAVLSGFIYFMIILANMPSLDSMLNETRSPAIIIVDKNGYEIRSFGRIQGDTITTNSVPPYVWQSIVAIEDRRFFDHGALDVLGIARSATKNIATGRIVQGGSSISQQLAKNLFLGFRRTFSRKIQEVILAFWLEERFSKEQILDLYMNRVSLVKGMRGIDAAARDLFSKTADELTLAEAVQITAMLKAPTTYNPVRNPHNSVPRAKIVLSAMLEQEYITKRDWERATSELDRYKPQQKQDENIYRYFADYVLDDINSRFGEKINSDMVVHTSLDSNLQQVAAKELEIGVAAVADKAVGNGAVIALSNNGAIRAMAGGTDYQESQFNRTIAARQPGSAFKSIVYLVALEKGRSPEDIVLDEQFSIGDYNPRNYNEKYYGDISIRTAFAKSVNSVPLKLTREYGLDTVLGMAGRLGIGTKLRREYSTILGASEMTLLELTTMYDVIFNGGNSVIPWAIDYITDGFDNVIYARTPSPSNKLLKDETVDAMTDMLGEVVKPGGTGRRAYVIGKTLGGKTGTSNDSRDAWFIGNAADITIGVWVGNDNGSPMSGITGGQTPADIFKRIVDGI